jgi:type IV secretory pathway VirJ component
MAVLLSGDGGWAEIDKTLASGLAASGVPTVGWNSLSYYWSPRTPEGASTDLGRILTHYTKAWDAPEVLLIGYSFGADVLPFLVTRLSPDARAHVRNVTLLGPSPDASFEFHVAEWFGGTRGRSYPTVPEVERLEVPVTCVQGAAEADSPCASLKGSHVTAVRVGSGHHFSGDYERLVEIILQSR